jgi:hypothetical protein
VVANSAQRAFANPFDDNADQAWPAEKMLMAHGETDHRGRAGFRTLRLSLAG